MWASHINPIETDQRTVVVIQSCVYYVLHFSTHQNQKIPGYRLGTCQFFLFNLTALINKVLKIIFQTVTVITISNDPLILRRCHLLDKYHLSLMLCISSVIAALIFTLTQQNSSSNLLLYSFTDPKFLSGFSIVFQATGIL